MTYKVSSTLLAALLTFASVAALSDSAAESPEAVVKRFMYGLYANDNVEYQKWTIPQQGSEALVGTRQISAEELEKLRREVDTLALRQATQFTLDGKKASTKHGAYPVGTKVSYLTQFRRVNLDIPVAVTEAGWKVDTRYWLERLRLSKQRLAPNDPEIVAKKFLYYILANKPGELAALSAASIDGKDFTKSNKLPGGDLDQILSLCIEMPIVHARDGEVLRLPSGKTVRGGGEGDDLVLVGMIAGIEIPFQLKRVADQWKVVPQHYFEMLHAANAI